MRLLCWLSPVVLVLPAAACGQKSKKKSKKSASSEMSGPMTGGTNANRAGPMALPTISLPTGPALRFLGFAPAAGGKKRVARVGVYNRWKKALYRVRYVIVFRDADGKERGRLPWSFNRPKEQPLAPKAAIEHRVPLLAVMGPPAEVTKISLELREAELADGTKH